MTDPLDTPWVPERLKAALVVGARVRVRRCPEAKTPCCKLYGTDKNVEMVGIITNTRPNRLVRCGRCNTLAVYPGFDYSVHLDNGGTYRYPAIALEPL